MRNPKKQKRSTVKNKRRRKINFNRFLFIFILIFFLGVSIYVVLFSEFLRINSINVDGYKSVSKETILERINPKISGEYLGFIEKNNIVLLRTNKIKKEILNDFKIIRDIKIKRDFPDAVKVDIVERYPQLIFCGAGNCFLIDEQREAYDQFNLGSENKDNLIILTDESCKGVKLGDFIAEPNYIEYVAGIREKILELGIEVENNFKTVSFISKDIRVKTKEGWGIYFNEEISLEKEIKMLKIVLDNKINDEKRKDLEYIDLRIDNKIYYKFREGTPSQIAKEKADEASVESSAPITNNSSDN